MKITDFNVFMEFANDIDTKYKFYRLADNKAQLFMGARSGLWIWTETSANSKILLEIQAHGFIETELSKEELNIMMG